MATETDYVWLAGLLEGEGCFLLTKQDGRLVPRIQLSMTDKDVVERAAKIINGNVNMNKLTKRGKEVWRTTTARPDNLVLILTRILPHMGKRRTIKIKELLEFLGGVPSRT